MTRPLDVWRVCGKPVTAGDGCGCTCTPNDPSRWAAEKAIARLDPEKGGPVHAAPRYERGPVSKANSEGPRI